MTQNDAPAQPVRTNRKLYGVVYELVLRGQATGETTYVGMSVDIEARMRQHRSAASVARSPWKADILPGKRGYRILERVWSVGDPELDDDRLRRAEADWIDRRRPVHNGPRPVRPRLHEKPIPKRPVRKLTPTQQRAAARTRRRTWSFLILLVLCTTLAARLIVAMHLPWPAAPWIASPVTGGILAWSLFWWFIRTTRRFTRSLR